MRSEYVKNVDQLTFESVLRSEIHYIFCQQSIVSSLVIYTPRCPVGTCASTKRKVKPTRAMPPIWSEITAEQRQIVMSSLRERF